jgi:hypothetical protein
MGIATGSASIDDDELQDSSTVLSLCSSCLGKKNVSASAWDELPQWCWTRIPGQIGTPGQLQIGAGNRGLGVCRVPRPSTSLAEPEVMQARHGAAL